MKTLLVLSWFATQMAPPLLLQIHRELVRAGSEAAYQQIEEQTARLCAQLHCPHPYLAIESVTDRKEVWFFNGYQSLAEQRQVVEAYAQNAPLMAGLQENSKRKATLTETPVGVFANYRQDLSRGVPWTLGMGHYLVITTTRGNAGLDGTVFEANDGTKFVFTAVQNREEADVVLAYACREARVFAVRPDWSFPADSWVAADPGFWRAATPANEK